MIFLITGGYGFIGSAVIRHILKKTSHKVINIDNLTYASNIDSLDEFKKNNNHIFLKQDINKKDQIQNILKKYQPDYVMHLAAESHVDRSIKSSSIFIKTNIFGTYNMLECSLEYWKNLNDIKKNFFRFHHISTDEVYGDLTFNGNPFDEDSLYRPSSPYSASKASSDHLVRAWSRTYNLPTIVTNCSNNFGPFQNPEKLIPTIIINAINGSHIPVYGNGKQVRDWIFVEDHANALYKVAISSKKNITYNIGGSNELSNLDLIYLIFEIMDKLNITKPNGIENFSSLIKFVEDRPGHDKRYAINSSKILEELSWKPQHSIEAGLEKTIKWYLNNLKN